MFTGLPDFGHPDRSGVAEGYLAYEQPGVLTVVPGGLTAAPLAVDRYLQERDDGIASFALVTAAFTLDTATDTTSRDQGRQPLTARPAPLGSGLVRLTAPADLQLGPDAFAPQPCDAAAGTVLPTLVRLDGVAGDLLAGALRGGVRTLGAVALLTVHGLAARGPGTLTVDVDALIAAVGDAPVHPDDLAERIRGGLAGLTVTGGPAERGPLDETAPVADRIVARLATAAFGPGTEDGWVFAPVAPHTMLTFDLTEPVAAVRLLRLTCDPVLGDGGDSAIRQHTAPPLTDGREQVTVYSTLTGVPAGMVAATVLLNAPPVPPARPFAAQATVHLVPPEPGTATLRLAAGEALVYDLEGAAILETDRGPRALTGLTRRVNGDTTPVVNPADLGLRLIPAHADDELLRLADVTVTLRATRLSRDPAVFVSRATLSADDGPTWLAVPRDAATVTIEAQATTHGPDVRTVRQMLPDAAIWLDADSFADAPWRDAQPVVVEAAGLRIAGAKDGDDWRFLPLTAGPVRDETGTAQLSLVETPALSLLSLTTALLITDAAQATARAACLAAGAAPGVRLSPAPFEVEGAAELRLTRDGQQTVIATAKPSGAFTQDAAFSTTLDGPDVAVVKQALTGTAGLLAVRYLIRVAASGPLAQALGGGTGGSVAVVSDAATWQN